MGKELLNEDSIADDGDSSSDESPFFSKAFDEAFPYYLSLGMTYDQYWNDNPLLVIAYRKAEDIRSHRRNWEMWMEGMYTYDAIRRLIPSLNMWKPKEPIEYMEEPYPLTKKEYEDRIRREEKRKQDEIKDKMMAFAMAHKAKPKVEVKNNG